MRSAAGQQLIELMVAVAVSGFLAIAMGLSLAQTMASSTGSENQLKAHAIAQELLDRVRRTPYALLAPGTYQVQVYSDDGAAAGTLPFQIDGRTGANLPLLMDLTPTEYAWSAGATANRLIGSSTNGFATAFVTLAAGPTTSSTAVTIVVSWSEGAKGQRTSTLTSVISQYGLHN